MAKFQNGCLYKWLITAIRKGLAQIAKQPFNYKEGSLPTFDASADQPVVW